MGAIQHYDIAIIGAGITGLSASYHLQKAGLRNICLFADQTSLSEHAAGMLSAGLIDNFTRVSQRHGTEKAKDVWSFSIRAFQELQAFAKTHGIEIRQGKRLRLIDSRDEWVEAAKAVSELENQGFQSRLLSSVDAACSGLGSSPQLIGVQDDAVPSGAISIPALLKALQKDSSLQKPDSKITRFEITGDGVLLETSDQKIRAEIVILANHLNIRDFLPQFRDVLVSSQDQWHSFELAGPDLPFPAGTVLTWTHGHIWALVEDAHHIRIGGARFMRPMAGFEADEAALSEKVQAFLRASWDKLFPQHRVQDVLQAKAGLDIRPCDELPVIGPLFGESRVLMGAGFMGQGMTLGFAAGKALADLALGLPSDLPRSLWPERHRSLPMDLD